MNKFKKYILAAVLFPLAMILSSCSIFGFEIPFDFDFFGDGEQTVFVEDFNLPTNFVISFGEGETVARLAKIGNDWYGKTPTNAEYFFKYNAENEYTEYTMSEGIWSAGSAINFEEMTDGLERPDFALVFFALQLADTSFTKLEQTEVITIGGVDFVTDVYHDEYSIQIQDDTINADCTMNMLEGFNLCVRYSLDLDGSLTYYTATELSTTVTSFSEIGITVPTVA